MGTHGGRWHLLDCLLDGEWDPLAMEGPGKATWRVLNLRNNPPNLFHPNSASPAPQAVFSGPSCFMPCVQPKAPLAPPPTPQGSPRWAQNPNSAVLWSWDSFSFILCTWLVNFLVVPYLWDPSASHYHHPLSHPGGLSPFLRSLYATVRARGLSVSYTCSV